MMKARVDYFCKPAKKSASTGKGAIAEAVAAERARLIERCREYAANLRAGGEDATAVEGLLLALAAKESDTDCENIYMVVDLPFVPAVGTMLKLTEQGDFIKINDVMLDISPGGDGLLVGLEEPQHDGELRPWSEMKAQGWKIG